MMPTTHFEDADNIFETSQTFQIIRTKHFNLPEIKKNQTLTADGKAESINEKMVSSNAFGSVTFNNCQNTINIIFK